MMFDPRRLDCLCDECPFKSGIPVLPPTPTRCKLIVVGEAPGADETVFGEYFVGRSGEFFNECLEYLGIDRRNIHVTNACMCEPHFQPSPEQWRKAIACCEPRLQAELKKTGCKTALAYGGKALYALTGPVLSSSKVAPSKKLPSIFAWAGAPLPGWKGHYDKLTVLATLHPAFCLREKGWNYKPPVYIHTQRAWDLAMKRLPAWEWPPIYTGVNNETLKALREIKKAKTLTGSDVETRGVNPLRDTCMCIGLANDELAVCVPWEEYKAGRHGLVPGLDNTTIGNRIKREVISILEDPNIPLGFQNGPHDLLTFQRLGIKARGYTWDTLPAHATVASGRRHDLGWIMCEESHAPRWKEEKHTASNEKGAKKFSRRDPVQLREYCAKDSYTPVWLREPLGQRLSEEHNGWAIYDLFVRNMRVAMKMQTFGWRIDKARMLGHRKKLGQRKSRAKQELRVLARKYWPRWGKTFNPDSQAHLRALVFNKLRVRPHKWSLKTELPTLDKSVLSELKTHDNPLVAAMARAVGRYRQYTKLRSTYCDPVKFVDRETSCVHPSWRVTGPRTLRWSCSPGIQIIPQPVIDVLKDGREVVRVAGLRDMFIPKTDRGWIVRADYDQLEIKIMALLSGCEKLLSWFANGDDVHRMIGSTLFGHKNPEDLKEEERNITKNCEYGWCYGADPRTLWHTLVDGGFTNMTLARCMQFDEVLRNLLPEIPAWHDQLLKTAYDDRYIEAPLSGHRLYLYGGVKSTEAFNLPVQHTAADIINPAVEPISEGLNWKTEGITGQIHDELVLCGERPLKLARLLLKHMEREVILGSHSATFTVGLKVGKDWANCVSVDRVAPLTQAITSAMQQCGKKRLER